MLSVDRRGPRRLDIALSGQIDSQGMKDAIDTLLHESEDLEDGRLLYRVGNFDFPSIAAIAVKLAQLPALFRLMRRVSRVAVLSDKRWLQKVAELEGKLLPNLEIRAFDSALEAEALAWLEE